MKISFAASPVALLTCCALVALPCAAASAADIQSGTAVRSDVSPPLRTLQPTASQGNGAHPARHFGKTLDELRLAPRDRGRQSVDAPAAAPIPGSQWEGINNINGVLPPDTNGDVGPRDYVQWVNLSLQIWGKNGVSRLGPVPGNTLWQGFGGVCETTNQGDPVALYDRDADRWVLAQFAFTVKGGHETAPYYECVAVSQTGDPTGSWNRYAFLLTGVSGPFPDYPKLGVWNDAYYVTTNNFGTNSFSGAGIYALDRTKMLAGDPTAGFVGQQLAPQYGGLLPAHRDGPTPPPAGAPGYFLGVDTSGAGGSGSNLQLWTMHPNFTTPASTTVSGPTLIGVTGYSGGFCGSLSAACVPQKGTTQKLDPLSDRLMNRLEYRNFGDHESLLATHNVNAGSDQAGERWYELRGISSTPSVYQQGTYAPADGVSRWMGSAAMDGYGDIALGYSASSATLNPSIRYTGRLAGDPLGSMTVGEQSIVAGSGSQTGYDRWGDYSSMSVDPVDDATFWYTQEYYSTTSAAGWRTRIASFKLVSTPTVTLATPTDGAASTATPGFSGNATGGTGDVTVKVHSGTSASGPVVQTLTATPAVGGAWSASASPALAEGSYTAQAQRSDASGHVGYSTVSTFRVDGTAPVPTVTAPASGAVTNDSTPTFSGTGGTASGDLSAIAVDVHSGGAGGPIAQTLNTTRSAGGAWSVTPSTALPDGGYTAVARQSDSAGNGGSSAPVSFSIDATPPAVSLTGPGSSTNDTTPAFNGTAGAADLAAVSVKIYSGTTATGTVLQTLGATQSSGAWGPVSATALAQGTYTARAQQSDAAGNTGFSAPVTFTVDTAAPAVTVTSPADGSVTGDSTPAIAGGAGNASGDSTTVTLRIYGPTGLADPPLQTIATTRSSGTWSALAATLADGVYKVQASQTDSATNTGTSALVSFTVDATPPAVAVTAPADGSATANPAPALGGTASEPSTVTVRVHSGTSTGGTVVQTLTPTPSGGHWAATPSALAADGPYTVEAQQTDAAANTGTGTATFTLDTTPPALTLTSPTAGSSTGDTTPTFQGAAGTAARDVAAVTVSLWSGTNTSVAPLQTPAAGVSAGSWSATPSALAPGTYTVRAEQSDTLGNKQTRQSTFTVGTNQPPVASFGFAPASPLVGSLVAFDGSGSSDPGGSIATWTWSFGDGGGATGSVATASHAYSAAGSYTAQLTVTDGAGGSASITHPVSVAAPQATLAQVQPEPQSASPGILVPQLSVRLLRQRLRTVLRHGLSYILSSNVAGTARMTLVVSKRTARRLGLGRRVTLASSRRDVLAGTPLSLALRPGRAVRAHLAGVSRLTATLRVTLGQTTVEQPVTLR